MKLRHRAMQPGDIRECVDIIANHPVIPASGRGRERRRHLLAYVREHPEELRPGLASFQRKPHQDESRCTVTL